MRAEHRVRLPLLQPTAVEGLRVPGRVMQEVVQRLPAGAGYDRRHLHQRLVVLAGQEQPDQILAQRRALLEPREQVIELGTELVNRLGGGGGRFARCRHGNASLPGVDQRAACPRRTGRQRANPLPIWPCSIRARLDQPPTRQRAPIHLLSSLKDGRPIDVLREPHRVADAHPPVGQRSDRHTVALALASLALIVCTCAQGSWTV
jgi:hypothetical protein